jgi:bifunctional non-homologous end joining protein LigD
MTSSPIPSGLVPMQPELSPPFHHDGWVYEEKYDGWRIVAYKDDGGVRLMSRAGVDHASRFPHIAAAVAGLLAPRLILDGEVCVFDDQLVSQRHLLTADAGMLNTPPVYMVFDCLYERQRDLRELPLDERRALLEEEVSGHDLIHPARRLPDEGLEAWGLVRERHWEGLVGKDPSAPYREGTTRRWLKVKVRQEGTFVVGGVTGTRDNPAGLLVGVAEAAGLRYVGTVEWGSFGRLAADLVAGVGGLVRPSSPFVDLDRAAGVLWLEPVLRAEVSYSGIVEERLRDPTLRELRAS